MDLCVFVLFSFQLHCNEVRKQKQMEFEILSSPIQGWEGQVKLLVIAVLLSHYSTIFRSY